MVDDDDDAQVAYEFTLSLDTGSVSYRYPGRADDLLTALEGIYDPTQVGQSVSPMGL